MADYLEKFGKFFTNLFPYQKAEIERALLEIQDSKELTSLESSVGLLKRKVDQRLPIPQPIAKATIRGAVLEWPPLPDQRVNFYEVDVSNESTFAIFDTFPTYGVTTVLDGLTQTTFVRVRGVRRDGTTTPNSETLTILPTLFDVTAKTDQVFYLRIEGTEPVTVLGGPGTVFDYVPINPSGNSKVWGFISTYADPAVGMFGLDHIVASVVVKIKDENGEAITDTVEWYTTMGEFFNSHSIGPFVIHHPELNQQVEVRLLVQDITTKADGTARSEDVTEVMWAHLNILELGV